MSVLSNMQSERATPSHMETSGGTVVHIRQNGVAQTFTGSIDEQPEGRLQDDSEGRHSELTAVLLIPFTDVSGIAADIDDQGQFTVDGLTWRVSAISRMAGCWSINLRRRSNKTTKTMRKSV